MLHHSCCSLLLTYLCNYKKILILFIGWKVALRFHMKKHSWCPPDSVLMLLAFGFFKKKSEISTQDTFKLCYTCYRYVSYAKYSHYKLIFSTHTGFVNVSFAKSTRSPVMYLTILSFHCFTEHNPLHEARIFIKCFQLTWIDKSVLNVWSFYFHSNHNFKRFNSISDRCPWEWQKDI